MKRGALALAAAWFLAACAAGDAYLISAQALAAAADPRVVILPFENQTTDLAAPGMLRELAAERFSSRGYAPVDAAETELKLRELGVTDGGQLPSVRPADIAKLFGADLLCYGTLEDFTFQNVGFIVRKSVRLRLKLVSAASGETLFEASGSGKDVKVYLDADEAKIAFIEATAAKLIQNLLKSPLRQEARTAVNRIFDRLPRR
ncbi:MAG: hypothetical protein A3J79_11225 [Elusimicrobia bacterium RIFOXYB2_FULL_62_6]|nr:MAG: hypothetical protein A3J79_11225 [Elusimicrobia bacterium RIFOXYB2_FULL_62_6]